MPDETPNPLDPNATQEFSASTTGPGGEGLIDGIGSVIAGKYRLVELIGQGGMGAVYLAQQTEPVRREVAVKLIRTGADSASVLARFDAERQALALMEHPHIARVYDGGTTPMGMPFFVMELVRGIPLTAYCDQHRLDVKARLELFVSVCQAVQHAHQKGIIHRDLKPGNVLVTEVDGKPVPKVIDFGLAKATEQSLTDMSFEDTGLIVGTATYMSPEQADPTTLDIDTRTDVYALGVMLYELLAGLPPIDAGQFKRGAVLEILRMVREVEPPRPSTRLSSAGALPSIAANRNIEPGHLQRILRGELDWVVMKALEKDRSRRYETVNGLARDVQRYLADEVVEARPPSSVYRLRKFVRRHRGQVIAASLVLLALVGGIVGTTLGLIEARMQRDAADKARAKAVAETEAKEVARREEEAQRRIAEQANQQAVEALKSFTDSLMTQVLGNKEQLSENEKAILRNAQKQWEVFAQSKGDTALAREIRAEGAAELAIIQYRLGMNVEAEANDRAALALRKKLAAEFPEVPHYQFLVGMSHQNLGASLRGNGNRAEAEENFGRAVAAFGLLAAKFPKEAKYSERQSRSLVSLGNATRAREDWKAAEKHYRAALVIQKKLAKENPQAATYRDAQADSHWGLAFTLKRAGNRTESEEEYRQAVALKESLAAELPAEGTFRHQAANLRRELGVFLYDGGQDEAGARLFPKALETLDQLAAEFPSMPIYQSDLARCRRDYGKVLGYLQKPVEAVEQFQQAVTLGEKLVRENPTVLPYKADLGLCYFYFADLLRDGDNPAQSLEWYDKAISTLAATYAQDRSVYLTKSALFKCHAGLAEAYGRLGKHTEAVQEWDKAMEMGSANPQPMYRGQRAYARAKAGQFPAAIAELTELTKSDPQDPVHWYKLACVYSLASVADAAKKEEYTMLALQQLQGAVTAGYKNHARMGTDEDLAPLHGREEFKKMIRELESK